MEVFVCGGAVRDIIMRFEPKDIDFVVVNSNHDEMVSNGFKRVGLDFPVYLHPETGDEYALARTEVKTSPGYNGFSCEITDVSLVQDLSRRDCTCNSIAVSIEDWEQFKITKCPQLIIDPFNGQADIHNKVLKHTSEAFQQDPVRVLRVARFAARYNFTVHSDTLELMKNIVHELNHVPTERIWMEFAKGLTEPHPHIMFQTLQAVGAFDVDVMKPYYRNEDVSSFFTRVELLQRYSNNIKSLPGRFALIGSDFTDAEYNTHRIPNDCKELSKIVNTFGMQLSMFSAFNADFRLQLIMNIRAISRPEFVHHVMDVVDAVWNNRTDDERNQLFKDLSDIKTVDAEAIAVKFKKGDIIKDQLFNARVAAMSW